VQLRHSAAFEAQPVNKENEVINLKTGRASFYAIIPKPTRLKGKIWNRVKLRYLQSELAKCKNPVLNRIVIVRN
jgi:hypothetical protein